MKPDRVVLGVESDHARSVMAELYAPFVRTGKPIIFMDIPSAEMTKYAANAMLATRISFMNEIAERSASASARTSTWCARASAATRASGRRSCFPGPGYGGSCFPEGREGARVDGARSASAAAACSRRWRRRTTGRSTACSRSCREALGGNVSRHARRGLGACVQAEHRRHARVAGADADRRRCSPRARPSSRTIRRRCTKRGAASATGSRSPTTNYEALDGADALVIVTDWNEYRHPDFERMKAALATPDRRSTAATCIDAEKLRDARLHLPLASAGRGA